MMKLLIAIKYASVYSGNFIPSIIFFAKYCVSRGTEVGFAFPLDAQKRDWIKLIEKSFDVYYFGNEKNIIEAIKIDKYIRKREYDSVYFHFSPSFIFYLSILNKKIKLIRHVHTDMGLHISITSKIKYFIKKPFYLRMKHIYVSEKLLSNENMSKFGNCIYLKNSLVTTRFNTNKLQQCRNELRKKFKLKNDSIVFLVFGWNLYVKGVDIALKAFEKLVSVDDNVNMIIVTGEHENIDNIKKTIKEATQMRIRFVEPVENVSIYYAISDILLSSSRSEGFSYSILEALYLGKTVVTSNLQAVSWSFKYPTVFSFISEDIEDCFKKMIIGMNNLSLNENLTKEVSLLISEDFSIDKWANTIYDFINS